MAIQVDTTSVPGSTIVYDDSNGGVSVIPNDYSSTLNSIKEGIERLNPDIIKINASADGVSANKITLSGPSSVSDKNIGFFIEGNNIPTGTYIIDYSATGDPINYELTVNEVVPAFSGTIYIAAPIVKLTKELAKLSESTSVISNANDSVKRIVTGEDEVSGAGIPFKDAYAALSMGSLIKALEDEQENVNALVAKTKAYLATL